MNSKVITPEQVEKYNQGWCPRCLGICACRKCLNKAAQVVGGAAPVFSAEQEKAFALHMLAVLRPHIADFTAARDAEAYFSSALSITLPRQNASLWCLESSNSGHMQ